MTTRLNTKLSGRRKFGGEIGEVGEDGDDGDDGDDDDCGEEGEVEEWRLRLCRLQRGGTLCLVREAGLEVILSFLSLSLSLSFFLTYAEHAIHYRQLH
ncbi:hypothetical protein TWF506_001951 [Arthrobotrys conoides]|uniref:Uncharacterized protein n=1 Tax=Arthrobotrys conoides TaxID=74498 RepID=A0AAN8S284_9PEZI